MQKIYVGLLVVAIAAMATPVNAAQSSTYEKNFAYFLGMIGDVDLNEQATFVDGRTMTVGEALTDAATKAGAVDLSALTNGQAPSPGTHAGDIWVLESGAGDCVVTSITPSPVPQQSPNPQAYVYAGAIGQLSTTAGDYTLTIGWTDKTSSLTFGSAGFTSTGISDEYCFNFFGSHFAFPFIDGVVTLN